jgi:hypothetical protein
MLIDLHVHPPEGLTPDALAAALGDLPLDGLLLVGDGAFAPLEGLGPPDGVRLFSAAELSTDRGHYIVIVPEPHAMPPLDEVFGARTDGRFKVRDVLARTQALGGVVIAAHPYDAAVAPPGGDVLYTLPHLGAVEALNATHPPMPSPAAVEAAEVLGLPCTGGSGTRALAGLGRAATLFADDVRSEADLVAAIAAGHCWPVELGDPPRSFARGGHERDRGGGDSGAREGGRRRRRRR